MSEVYSNAYCTISATGSANSSEGCFIERTGLSMLPVRPTRLYQEEDDDKTGMGLTMLTPNLPQWKVVLQQGPMNNRLWALQERALSHRILHWTKHELFWECWEKKASESWPSGLLSRQGSSCGYDDNGNKDSQFEFRVPTGIKEILQKIPSEDAIMRKWRQIAVEASYRNLTNHSDILPALSGIASLVH